MQVQKTTEPVVDKEVASEVKESDLNELRKITEYRHKAFTQLVSVHLNGLLQTMMATNGVTINEKNQARKAVTEALEMCLDFGLGITNAEITVAGKHGRAANTLAAVLTQALDNRTLLIMDNLREQEKQNKLEGEKENVKSEV